MRIDPSSILDYIAVGGYSALAKALTGMTPEAVLNEVKAANLRGRGGGGFPAGRKWETTRNAHGEPKYVIVNADEGDPGAYMDRSLLEGNPHSVLEGLIIGAYAIGASEGFIYVRQEYPLARKHAAEGPRAGAGIRPAGQEHPRIRLFLRRKDTPRRGRLCVRRIQRSDERHRGPRRRTAPQIHPYLRKRHLGQAFLPEQRRDLGQCPPHHQQRGAEWFRSMGTEGSKGTKIFSLVGKVKNTGLVEVPMGITLRDIIFKIGGGVPKGKKFKAVQTGGPSGGVIPESLLDLPVDFDELTKVGSMMGSGGMIVMDEDTCMVDTARYYINFLAHESCGKCVPCREGLAADAAPSSTTSPPARGRTEISNCSRNFPSSWKPPLSALWASPLPSRFKAP